MSAMDVDAGVEEKKGEERAVPATTVSAERTQKGKGEGDRNIMLHPVCSLLYLQNLWCSQVDRALRICTLGKAVGSLNSRKYIV